MLVCIGQTPGYSVCSQTTLRPHGFSRSFYVLLQLLLTAFVSPIGAAAEVLVLTYSQNIHKRSRVKPLYRTPRPQSAAVRLVVTAALSRGSQVLYSEHSPSQKPRSTKILKD